MEESSLQDTHSHEYIVYPTTFEIILYVLETFNVICTLCLVLTIVLRKELRGNPNNWSVLYFAALTGLMSFCAVVFGSSTDAKMAKTIPPTICVILTVLLYSAYITFYIAQLFLMIDRVDWLSDSKRHNTRMTPKAYIVTIGVLLVVGFVSSVAFFARPAETGFSPKTCVHLISPEFDTSIRILNFIQAVAFFAIIIAAPIVYKKRQPSGDKDEDAKEAMETLIITCLLSATTCILLILQLVFHDFRRIRMPLFFVQMVYYGIACLLMLGVYSKFRRGFLCQSADTSGEKVPLL